MKSTNHLKITGIIAFTLLSSNAMAESSSVVRHIPRSVSGGSHSAANIVEDTKTETTTADVAKTENTDTTSRARLAETPATEKTQQTIRVIRRGQSGGSAMADQIAVGTKSPEQ